MESRAVVLFGSNLGNRQKHLSDALQQLTLTLGAPEKISSVYESASWGKEAEPDYLNLVAGFITEFSAREILEILLETEIRAGRMRTSQRYESRTIDLDLLFYGDQIIYVPHLHVPHPRMENRRFTLVPLNEIYPDMLHPIHGITVSELLSMCPDHGTVIKRDPVQ